MRRVAVISLAVVASALLASSVTSCSCDASTCPGPQFDVVVDPGVDAVEICGEQDDCRTVHVGDRSPGGSRQSFTIAAPTPESWSVPRLYRRVTRPIEWWRFRALDAHGDELVHQVISPAIDYFPRGCHCGPHIEILVLPNEIRETGVSAKNRPSGPEPSWIVVSTDPGVADSRGRRRGASRPSGTSRAARRGR